MNRACPYCGHPTMSEREEHPTVSMFGLSLLSSKYEVCTNRSCKRFGNIVG